MLCGAGVVRSIFLRKYEVSHGILGIVLYNLPLVRINCVNGTPWQFIFSSEHTVYSPASQIYECETWLLQLLLHLKLPLLGMDCILPIF